MRRWLSEWEEWSGVLVDEVYELVPLRPSPKFESLECQSLGQARVVG